MNNIDKWPQAFDARGIPKVGGRWEHRDGSSWSVLGREDAGWFRVLGSNGESNAGLVWFLESARAFLGFSSPAPLVAPPHSLKAAVQQEGLSIPPQVGMRHEEHERLARVREAGRDFAQAKAARWCAQVVLAADLAYDAEADAIREKRIVRKDALKEMGAGDRRCFDLRGLREFEAIKSVEHAKWNWWKS